MTSRLSRLLAALSLPLLLAAAPAPEPEAVEPIAVVQDYEPRPAIWSLSDEDTTIYLFGTVHALPQGFKWRSKAFEAVVAEADELVVETRETEEQDKLFEAFILGTLNVDRPPLIERVPADKREQLETLLADSGVERDVLDMSPTWSAVFGLAVAMMEGGGEEFDLGADTTLEEEFGKAGKPVEAIEDFLPIMVRFNMLPEEEQQAMLVEMLEEADPADLKDPLKGTHDWAQGKAELMVDGLSEEELGAQLYDILLRQRNSAWTDWIESRLEEPGKVLVAVGAGHFAGADSLQSMLGERGLSVTRID